MHFGSVDMMKIWRLLRIEYICNIKPPFKRSYENMFSENQLSALSHKSGLLQIFQSREEAMYLNRLSQCEILRSFQVVYSQDNLYHIKCAHPPCHFYLKVSSSKTGEHLSSGVWWHTCSINHHVISKYKSPALDCNFLARYLLQHIKNGVT